jgi:Zn-dependent M28 family amino/carboxypeptidase
MLKRYKLSYLIALLYFNISICTAQSVHIDSLITPASLQEIVQTLAADTFHGRLTGSVDAAKAALYISNAFKNAGTLPVAGLDGYFMPFEMPDKATAFNVIGALPGKSRAKETIIFSAHYDHIGTITHTINIHTQERGKPEAGDYIYNGANDNASGISGLIHLARYFAQTKLNERTLLFVAFSGEEEGLHGSYAMADQFDPGNIVAVINMDMIGRPMASNKKYPYITGSAKSTLRTQLNNKLTELAPTLQKNYFHFDLSIEPLYNRSDNYPFARKGIVAHTIIATNDRDPYYHSLNDEWETLDFSFMANVVKAIALSCTGLVDGTDTPE